MQYFRCKDKIFLRLDKGEEVIEKLLEVAAKEGVKAGSVSGIGASDDFTVGIFKTSEKRYSPCNFKGDYEITSLLGNISAMDGKPYAHIHMTAAGEGANTVGGHLTRANVSVTCEIAIDILETTAKRKFDGATGVNLLEFN